MVNIQIQLVDINLSHLKILENIWCTVQTGRVGKNKNVSDLELLSYFFFFSEIQQIFVKPLNKQFSSDSWQTNGDSSRDKNDLAWSPGTSFISRAIKSTGTESM